MVHTPLSPEEYTRRRIRALSALAILVLLFVALFMLRGGTEEAVTTDDTAVLPPPTEEEIAQYSILSPEGQAKLKEIQEKFSRGEIPRQDAERMMEEVMGEVRE